MKLFIKNLYLKEQKRWLVRLLDEMRINYEKPLELGVIMINPSVSIALIEEFISCLSEKDLEVIKGRKKILSEQIKYVVHEMLDLEERPRENYSSYISSRLFFLLSLSPFHQYQYQRIEFLGIYNCH